VRYFVIGDDGQKYGPADLATLNSWIGEQRLLPTQQLEEETSGVRMAASAVQGLNFPLQNTTQFASGQPYQQHYNRPGAVYGDDGSKDVKNAWIYAILGLFCCLFLYIPGILAANKAIEKGNPGGVAARNANFVCIALTIILGVIRVIAVFGSLKK